MSGRSTPSQTEAADLFLVHSAQKKKQEKTYKKRLLIKSKRQEWHVGVIIS